MKAHSYCSFHPSREAQLRCHHCQRWLCDRCVQVLGDEVFCSHACHLRDLGQRLAGPLLPLLRRRLEPAWTIGVVSAAAALLLATVGVRVAELVELSATPPPPVVLVTPTPTPRPALQGALTRDGSRWRVDVDGPAGATVLLLLDDKPLRTLQLDSSGHGQLNRLRLRGRAPSLTLVELSERQTVATSGTPPAATPGPAGAPAAGTPTTRVAAGATPTPPIRTDLALRRSAPPVLHHVSDAGPRIALTFDGGSSANGTAGLLDVLDELDLRVTMLVTGTFIERHAALVRRAVHEGHEIGNHTYSHPHLTTYARNQQHHLLPNVSREMLHEQLRQAEQAFFTATGRRMAPYWRAPYGEENASLRAWALELGYLCVRWSSVRGASLDAWDWVDDEHSFMYQSSERIMERLLRFPSLHGGIVLMHLASDRPEPAWQALPELVQRLRERQVQPMSVSEVLQASPRWRPWLERARQNHLASFGPAPTQTPVRPATDR